MMRKLHYSTQKNESARKHRFTTALSLYGILLVGVVVLPGLGWAAARPVVSKKPEMAISNEPTGSKTAMPVSDDSANMVNTPEESTAPADDKVKANAAQKSVQPLPEIGTDQLAVFVLQRGYYVTTNLGAFFTFGGKRGYSNIQPYMAIKAGVDLNDWLSVQLAGATGFSAGNAINNANQAGVGVTSYSIFNLGAEMVGSFRPTERFAIEPVLGGGMTRINPALYKSEDGRTYSAYTGHIDGGVEFKYLTLLTDFSAGASVMAYYLFGVNVPAMSIAFTLRYTF